MLEKVISSIINEDWDWFLGNFLKDYYEKRRKCRIEETLAIDLLLDIKYPPLSSIEWNNCFDNKQRLGCILLVYLTLDLRNYLDQADRDTPITRSARAKRSTIEERSLTLLRTAFPKLANIEKAFDFPISIINLSKGLWALDNDQLENAILSLSHPTVNLQEDIPKTNDIRNLIVNNLIALKENRLALYMKRIYPCDDENFDAQHLLLLLKSGQLIEALKYQRSFSGKEDYQEILEKFVELCRNADLTKSLGNLKLNANEENQLNKLPEIETVVPQSVQILKSQHHNDSPAKNTRSARRRKVK